MTTLNTTTFREQFEAYSDEDDYPDSTLTTQYSIGKIYLQDNNCLLSSDAMSYILDLMLAHLLYIKDLSDQGNRAGVVTSVSEGDVSASLAEPPISDNWSYWLNSSPYGIQILTMLEIALASGLYIGGSTERRGFRKANGGF